MQRVFVVRTSKYHYASPGRKFFVALATGIFFGFCCAFAFLQSNLIQTKPHLLVQHLLSQSGTYSQDNAYDALSAENSNNNSILGQANNNETGHNSKASGRGRILCWIVTCPKNHIKKAIHVKNTWGARCDKLIFMSSRNDPRIGAIGLTNVLEGRGWLWAKTKEALKYIWKHHGNEADWFLKADDDTYVIMENLRAFLKDKNASEPLYYGARFDSPRQKESYMSGGAGYVLSKEALRRFIEEALPKPKKCSESREGAEDAELGRCLANVGVKPADTRDSLGRHRFLPLSPPHHFMANKNEKDYWYWKFIHFPQKQGMDCCSDNAISFHYVEPSQMYLFDYMIYHLKVDNSGDKSDPIGLSTG